MQRKTAGQLSFLCLFFFPIGLWLVAVKKTEQFPLPKPKFVSFVNIIKSTPDKPILWLAAAVGLVIGIVIATVLIRMSRSEFAGAEFKKFLRGTRIVSQSALASKTKERDTEQLTIGGIPVPTAIENYHILASAATGAGKSVVMRELAYRAILRGDKCIFIDPDGDLVSKFYVPGRDLILNPYDDRSEGWTFFNEIRAEYDYKRLALSIIPRGQTAEEEEWRSYGRLLFRETARKLAMLGRPSIREVFEWTNLAEPDMLKTFLSGTDAESLFVGADKALASARFVLSAVLPEHINMPRGDFTIREWLEYDAPDAGNLFITWREDMIDSLRPLISGWADVICSAVLSLPPSRTRRIKFFMDELASLEKLASLEDALTKGRKHGLGIVASWQSTAQGVERYGREKAQTLRSCFRSLVVLGGSKSDPDTAEDMSRALGEHEVIREREGRNRNSKSSGSSENDEVIKERVVQPAEIMSLPDLTGYVSFATDYPIAKIKVDFIPFKVREEPFIEKSAHRLRVV